MEDQIKNQIRDLVKEYWNQNNVPLDNNKVPVSGKVYDENELINLIDASLEGWWTEGKWNNQFESKLKDFLGIKHCLTLNSGSSANFLALKTLTSVKLKEKMIKKGEEIITVAAAFPTTVNPILDIGAVPVFVDINLETCNIRAEKIGKAITEKTKAIILAHTLGNPFNLKIVKEICDQHKLWLIEDNCDALGSKYNGEYTGTFGDLATLSFYPAHHITTAEGGAILTNNSTLFKIAKSLRDWGRDCWCPTGNDNTCQRRFEWKLGNLPFGYDHKYIYSEKGYNLKITDLQAAIGVAQLDKLPNFISKRINNFDYLYHKLSEFKEYFILPKATPTSQPSWFGFLLIIKDDRIERVKLMKYLNEKNVGTRLLFSGNIIKQPYFIDYNVKYRLIDDLKNTNIVMNNGFWIGVYPRLEKNHLDYIYDCLKEFIVEIEKNNEK